MKFTLSWLKEHLDTDKTVDELSVALTAIGLEIEEIQDFVSKLSSFTVAEVLEAEQHPDADKLRVCNVKAHDGERIIVCGAPNARAGIKVALADIGVYIPKGDFTIKKSKIRGVESLGMLCSADELGLEGDAAGILELPADAKVGDEIAGYLGVDDVLFEIAITPNRGDALGVYGIARDLAAAGMGTLKPIAKPSFKPSGASATSVTLESDACPYFVSRTISGVTNGESPDWMQRKLQSVGVRPISALVDITNYMTMTYGRPLHVYDADRLKGGITVRDTRDGEYLEALNDKAYNLPDGLCAIADESGVIGLGGVVGGTSTGCEADSVNVLLESAWFDPISIANTGRNLQIDSDARYRFERTVDPEFTAEGADIATQLIMDICGSDSSEVSELLITGNKPDITHSVSLSPDIIRKMSGITIDDAEIQAILEKLGFAVKASGADWTVTSPSYRPDMALKADIVEEVLRIYGYDNIPEIALPAAAPSTASKGNDTEITSRLVRRTWANRGLDGVYHYAFGEQAHALRFAPEGNDELKFVEVVNPISSDLSIMRTNLLPAMLAATSRNIARNMRNVALFEFGNVFFGASPDTQPMHAATVRTGTSAQHWSSKPKAVDAFDAKADLFAALSTLGVDVNKVKVTTDAPSWYHPGKSGRVSLGGKITLGYFGSIHPQILRMMDIEQEVVACEVMPQNIPSKRKAAKMVAIKTSDFQATKRDFAFIVDETVAAGDIINAINNAEKKLLQDVTLFDVYQGKGVEDGKKSIALSVTLQATDRTLSEDDITRVSDAIIAAAGKQGAVLR